MCALMLFSEGFFLNVEWSKMVISNVVVTFITVVFVIVIAHCSTMHDIAPHGATAAETLISSSTAVQECSHEY